MTHNTVVGLLFLVAGILIGCGASYVIGRMVQHVDAQEKRDPRQLKKQFYIIITVGIGVGYVITSILEKDTITAILNCAFITCIIGVIVVDWLTYEIPFALNVCIFIIGLIRLGLDFHNWSLYIIGFFAVSGILFILFQVSHGTWIGGGDVKLMAVAGLFLGWKLILVAFVSGCVVGSVIHLLIMAISKGGRMLAFGPYLSLGMLFAMVWGNQLASWYLSLLKI